MSQLYPLAFVDLSTFYPKKLDIFRQNEKSLFPYDNMENQSCKNLYEWEERNSNKKKR